MIEEFTKQELLIIWGSLIQSAVNNEKRLDEKLLELFNTLESMPGSDFEKRKIIRNDIVELIAEEGVHIDRILSIGGKIKDIEKERKVVVDLVV